MITTYKYMVRVHPMEADRAKISEVRLEKEFKTALEAQAYINRFNEKAVNESGRQVAQAVYRGKFNSVTGELV
jgi:hypothetical protein